MSDRDELGREIDCQSVASVNLSRAYRIARSRMNAFGLTSDLDGRMDEAGE